MKTVLLADDDAILRTLVRATLENSEYRIVEAADGSSALRLARQESPHLLILDWMMPGLTGIETARELLMDEATAKIPIIMLTAKDQTSGREQALALGIHAYLVKPFSPLELLEKIREILG